MTRTNLEEAKEELESLPEVQLPPTPPTPGPSVISTGSIVVDYLIGGAKNSEGQAQCPGIPRGRVTELYGERDAGKTTLALSAAAQCQRGGGTVCYLDYENRFPTEYAQDLGVDLSEDTFWLYAPHTWEEGASIIEAVLGEVDLIVVDTLSMASPVNFSEASVAELQADFMPKITQSILESDTALVYINTYRRLGNAPYHGVALKYYAALRLELIRVGTEYDAPQDDIMTKPLYSVVSIKNIKCGAVSSHQGHYAQFVIRCGEGIDNVRSIIDIAEARGLLGSDKGSGYELAGVEGYFTDKEVLRAFFINHPQQFKDFVEKMNTTGTE